MLWQWRRPRAIWPIMSAFCFQVISRSSCCSRTTESGLPFSRYSVGRTNLLSSQANMSEVSMMFGCWPISRQASWSWKIAWIWRSRSSLLEYMSKWKTFRIVLGRVVM